MSTDPDRVDPATAEAEQHDAEAMASGGADRPPTAEEEAKAEEARRSVEGDMGKVAENYEHMAKTGAEIKGEGQIEN